MIGGALLSVNYRTSLVYIGYLGMPWIERMNKASLAVVTWLAGGNLTSDDGFATFDRLDSGTQLQRSIKRGGPQVADVN